MTTSSGSTRFESTLFERKLARRRLLAGIGALGFGALVLPAGARAQAGPDIDEQLLTFALNLEYLEAEYYLRAAFGRGLADADSGANPGRVTGGRRVPFRSKALCAYAEEIARDEEAHVAFLRRSLGSRAVSRPAIDFADAFTAARAAGVIGPEETFDPFESELGFLFGAYLFEDVGVTAYNGAAPFITSGDTLEAAAGILAVEAYHAGNVRTQLYFREAKQVFGQSVVQIAQKLSDARDLLASPGETDQGIKRDNPFATEANIVPTDENAVVFSRTPKQVLNIVYLDLSGQATPGGFFPEGMRGDFSGVPSL
jgi:hypothetical protein